MKPNERVSATSAMALNWHFDSDASGSLSTQQLAATAAVESTRLLQEALAKIDKFEQLFNEAITVLRGLDITSLDETREAVREMLSTEFGLTRTGGWVARK